METGNAHSVRGRSSDTEVGVYSHKMQTEKTLLVRVKTLTIMVMETLTYVITLDVILLVVGENNTKRVRDLNFRSFYYCDVAEELVV